MRYLHQVTYTRYSESYSAHYELQTCFVNKKKLTYEGCRRKIEKDYIYNFDEKPKYPANVTRVQYMTYENYNK